MSTSVDEAAARAQAKSMLELALGGPEDEPPAIPGTAFGDYQLLDVIGRGSTCYVYKAATSAFVAPASNIPTTVAATFSISSN